MNITHTLTQPQTHIFILSGITAAAVVLYISFLFLSVVNISLGDGAIAAARAEEKKTATLDAQYLSLSRGLTREDAEALGLVEVADTHFVTRAPLAQNRITQDTLR